jgi:hypothetical protein
VGSNLVATKVGIALETRRPEANPIGGHSETAFVTNGFGLLGYFETKIYITDCRNRLSVNLTYRIQYSSRNFSCIRHPQDNKPF